ncbi:hypothetical protein SPRG_00309 [Saprolegnia parasitica CBS 223.65]|uniref:Heparinase II N-terminal domain-containing protein n=1 Tax=Saprolegnia parasitica (strain CBS 223.65) TaxID=695850 RepID=A0A067D8X6_SAPPC|nr:hypothetical protein SPRG_00309 [Saprolegnia parasitica CBS 223.65]KDO35462.1 hypothetical protein SPRG_00309 [Saprolegnia parasitica CBS 223.65]|eukprot:XP_012193799.1 hypothetical protein SPRG_00309 [Saprolegnia parasitica CBS 223.65]
MRTVLMTLLTTAVVALPSLQDLIAVLPDAPASYARPCADRSYWQPLVAANAALVRATRARATAQLASGMPPWDATAYELYFKTGNRLAGQDMMNRRHTYVSNLFLAECFDMTGTFLAALDASLLSLATQRTWVLAAHDPKRLVYDDQDVFVDLNAAKVSSLLATTLTLLPTELSVATRDAVSNQLQRRTLQPMLDRTIGSTAPFWWQVGESNWNAVCWNGMASALLASLPSKSDRATVLLALAEQSEHYLASFGRDGYGTEGVAYFNYGFQEFAELREVVCAQTNGLLDLFALPNVDAISHAPAYFEMRSHHVAAFGDARLDARFLPHLLDYVQWTYGESSKPTSPRRFNSTLPGTFMALSIPLSTARACSVRQSPIAITPDPLRHIFPAAHVAVLRGVSATDFDVTFKVGGNGGHSHNDMGSFAIVLNGANVLGDVGGPKYYDAKTFGPDRYKSPLMNAYGHPVPVVMGQLQLEAVRAQAMHPFSLRTDLLSDAQDVVSTDLAAAYNVSELQSLNRSVALVRSPGNGHVRISDTITMQPGTAVDVESVLTTVGVWAPTSNTSGVVTMPSGIRVTVTVSASAPFTLSATALSSYGVSWTRIGIHVTSTSASATVTAQIAAF